MKMCIRDRGIPGLGLGVFGAALATEISAAISFLYGIWILFSGKTQVQPSLKGLLRLDWEIDWQLLKIGAPQSLGSLLRSIGDVIVIRFVSGFGTLALAVMGIVSRPVSYTHLPRRCGQIQT